MVALLVWAGAVARSGVGAEDANAGAGSAVAVPYRATASGTLNQLSILLVASNTAQQVVVGGDCVEVMRGELSC